MPAGRPTIYEESTCDKAMAYIDSCEDAEEQVISGQSEKATFYQQKLRVNLPTIEGLALYLKTHRDTLYEWEKQHPQFSDILAYLRHKQLVMLINKGLSNDYNHSIVKVLLSKHGYTEKQETEHSGSVGTVILPKPVSEDLED